MKYQELFNHLKDEHGITLIEHELQEIVNIVSAKNYSINSQIPVAFIKWCIKNEIEPQSAEFIGLTKRGGTNAFPIVTTEELFEIFINETDIT